MEEKLDFKKMRRLSADIRIETIKALAQAGFGHIGGAMSIADVLAVLYGGVMKIDPSKPDWEERDYLVLSKGHSGPALYAALALKGYYSMDMLKTINKPGTLLPSHCDRQKTAGIDMTTGSLGQGISSALGIAIGITLKAKNNYVYCVIGDGELQEGQVWEAAQCAAHRGQDNFIVFIDRNRKQLDGLTEKICKQFDIEEKFRAFGWDAQTVRGYDVEEIYKGIMSAKKAKGKPSAIILDTYKGLGCNFAEEADFNHYMVIDQDMAKNAADEIERRLAKGEYPRGNFRW